MKKSSVLLAAILGLGLTATASAGDDRVIGAVLGGVAGGAIGGNLGGRDGAALGVVVGAALGAAVADDGRRHSSSYYDHGGYRDYRGYDRHYDHHHGGNRIVYRPVYRPAPPVRHVYHYPAPHRYYSHDRGYRRDHRDHRDHRDYRHDRGRDDRGHHGHRGHDRGRH